MPSDLKILRNPMLTLSKTRGSPTPALTDTPLFANKSLPTAARLNRGKLRDDELEPAARRLRGTKPESGVWYEQGTAPLVARRLLNLVRSRPRRCRSGTMYPCRR